MFLGVKKEETCVLSIHLRVIVFPIWPTFLKQNKPIKQKHTEKCHRIQMGHSIKKHVL